ncbi:hypothetical protein GCM10020000_80830 [Streptomyces olivoverticillatus]
MDQVVDSVARTVAELSPRHANLIRPFAEWHIIRDARRRSSRGRYTYAAHKGDCGNVLAAINFLNWLDTQHLSLSQLQQQHLEGGGVALTCGDQSVLSASRWGEGGAVERAAM